MTRTIIDIHILQTVPPSNLNRDDTGSPKTAIYGGVRRARVSSQAWKRATRTAFEGFLDRSDLGLRTKRVVEVLAAEIIENHPNYTEERASTIAKEALETAGIKTKPSKKTSHDEAGYLLFLSHRQISNLAELAVAADQEKIELSRTAAKQATDTNHSVDLSLFGRMVADTTDLNVDAAAQVAHAISVHGVENEYDYFTAVDDRKQEGDEEDAGAAMIGTVEFNSSTLYRYATVDVDRLRENLGDEQATARAIEAFVRAFITSMPTGKQNTFANRTLPDAVVVQIRDGQSINLVGAFEEPIVTRQSASRVQRATEALVEHAKGIEQAFGQVPVVSWSISTGPKTELVSSLGEATNLDDLVEQAGETVRTRLSVS